MGRHWDEAVGTKCMSSEGLWRNLIQIVQNNHDKKLDNKYNKWYSVCKLKWFQLYFKKNKCSKSAQQKRL